MPSLKFVEGDATDPIGEGKKLIVHCCNDLGAFGAGFVRALSAKWPEPEATYKAMEKVLGRVSLAKVEDDIWVANVIGQHGIRRNTVDEIPPIRYEALRIGFNRICKALSEKEGYSIHMPRVGSALAGGDFAIVEVLINDTFIRAGLDVTVYTLPGGRFFDSRA
jgi:hypothetical protein